MNIVVVARIVVADDRKITTTYDFLLFPVPVLDGEYRGWLFRIVECAVFNRKSDGIQERIVDLIAGA
jgi:hypothetical protein